MSPNLKSVEAAGLIAVSRKNDPTSVSVNDFFEPVELLKNEFAKIINSESKNSISLISSVSYGIATVAKNIKLDKGEEVLLASEQFPSNYYTWKEKVSECNAELKLIEHPQQSVRGREWNDYILESISEKTKIVSIGNLHWADGTLFALKSIREKLDKNNGYLIIDGTQSVGALPLDVQEIKPDALICGGYKWLLGPYSQGVAYYGERFKNGSPLEENWINRKDSQNFRGLVNYQDDYEKGMKRFDIGEKSNFILVPMLTRALQQINEWGVENIQNYCKKLVKPFKEDLHTKGFILEPDEFSANHLFGIRFPKGFDSEKVQEELIRRKIHVSVRGDAMRVSVHLFNTEEDLDQLYEVLTNQLD